MEEEENIKAHGRRVLIYVLPKPKVTSGGILVPEGIYKGRPNRARVVSLGTGPVCESFKKTGEVKEGDTILFDPYRVSQLLNERGIRADNNSLADEGAYAIIPEDAVHCVEE